MIKNVKDGKFEENPEKFGNIIISYLRCISSES